MKSNANTLSGTFIKSGDQISHQRLHDSSRYDGNCRRICVFVKYSPNREKMLGGIIENIAGEVAEGSRIYHRRKSDKLCVTRWTVRANCLKKILDNYEALFQLWEESLQVNLDFDTKSRIGGCKKQMKLFTFYFGLNLSQKLYAIIDILQ